MSADFTRVTAAHVERACRRAIEDGVPAGRQARSTFLVFEGRHLPAKYVLGLAYELATGRTLGPEGYTGGPVSGSVLERLGFQVLRRGPAPRSSDGIRPQVPSPTPLATRAGKAGLLDALRARFGEVSTEETFSWLCVPARDGLPADLAKIREALVAHRGFDAFDTPGRRLRCDFFLPSARSIVEVDERQHFTSARAVALRSYAPGTDLGFDTSRWIQECERIAAVDPSPPHRDEQRAYYDSVRDLLATRHGLRVVRVAETELSTPAGVARAVATIASLLGQGTADLAVATACIAGVTARTARENRGRILLLHAIAEKIGQRRWRPTVLLLPGGYFHLPVHIGHREYTDRIDHLTRQPFSEACLRVAQALDTNVVAGVDSTPWLRPGFRFEDAGDQLCVAWAKASIVGVGRKVFPTDGEADDLVIYAADMATPQRLAALGAGRRALLCSCYDMFGCTETAGAPGTRSRNIRWLCTDEGGLLERRSHRREVASAISRGVLAWEGLVSGASIGLAAIHGFTRSGQGSGKAYWQRHGIEKASAVLGGRMAFGAAHIEPPLPAPEVAVFAAKNGKRIPPVDHVVVTAGDGLSALVRLYRP